MHRRIIGLESEYGFLFVNRGDRIFPSERALEYLFQGIMPNSWSRDAFLPNGARIYQDTGSHPEYSTPECDSFRDVVLFDKAGEKILSKAAERVDRLLVREGIDGEVHVLKNNTDSAGNSYGCHENYLIDRNVTFWRLSRSLIPFFVTRQIVAGAGGLVRDSEDRVRFVISPRALHIREKISCSTTSSRPIINTRDEPHSDPQKYRRLHIIVGDSNMSEVSDLLKVATTALVLEVVEAGGISDRLSLEDPIAAIRMISEDPSLTVRVRLESGKEMTALEIQRAYLEACQEYFVREKTEEPVRDILKLWEKVLGELSRDDESLGREIDWVIKRRLLERYMKGRHHGIDDPETAMLDYQYHDVDERRGLYNLLLRQGGLERIASDREIEEAMVIPPRTTRARLRGDHIRAALAEHRSFTVDWTYMRLNDSPQETFFWMDPFCATEP